MFTGIGINIVAPRQQGGFSPGQLGEIKSWAKGDDASFAGAGKAGVYDHLNDTGTLGGQFDKATDAQPVSVGVGGLAAPVFRGTRRFSTTVAVASWTFMHDATSAGSLAISYYPYALVSGATLWATKATASGSRGLRVGVNASDQIEAVWSDGTSNTTLTSTVTMSVDTLYKVVVRKTATGVALSVNEETPVTTTITGSALDAAHVPVMGNDTSGAAPSGGLTSEAIVYGVDIGTGGATSIDSYLDRWDFTPDFSIHKYGDVLTHHYAGAGVTTETGVSALADQSGYNNDLVQATTTMQPALVSSWRNSEPALNFDGSDDHLRVATLNTGTESVPYTHVVVGEWDNDGGTGPFIIGSATVAQGIRHQGTDPTLNAGANFNSGTNAPTSGTPFIMCARANGASSEINFVEDGAAEYSATGNAGAGTQVGLTIGGRGAGLSLWDGIGAEWILYGDGITVSQMQEISAEMETKYDITPL